MHTAIQSSKILLALSLVGAVSCNNTTKGALIGAGAGGAAGAGVGVAISKDGKGAAIGAIVGAIVGGTVGAIIGKVMDDRAKQIEQDLEDAKVERVGEGILVTFNSGILFDVGKSDLQPQAQQNIQKLTEVLERYDDMDVLIAGHTDATGSSELNHDLAQKRAKAVADYAASHGVEPSRIKIIGEGEDSPVASNDTAEGRAQNRRVEVAVFANGKLKDKAEKQAGES